MGVCVGFSMKVCNFNECMGLGIIFLPTSNGQSPSSDRLLIIASKVFVCSSGIFVEGFTVIVWLSSLTVQSCVSDRLLNRIVTFFRGVRNKYIIVGDLRCLTGKCSLAVR